MKIQKRKLRGFLEIIFEPYKDNRGMLVRLYDEREFKRFGLNTKWVQESYSQTLKKHTLRGLHFQFPPYSECKLIRIIRGEILWVVVDLRKKSETFGCWESIILSMSKSIYVERGFAHGCISLSDNCDLIIHSDNYFSEVHGRGIIWNDADLNIDWHLEDMSPIIAEQHSSYPTFNDFKKKYGGLDVK